MKKILFTLVMLLGLGTAALAGEQNPQLRSLVSAYKGTEGFEIVDIGGIGLGLLKAAARNAADSPEDREALKLFNGLKRLTVVDFSDAPADKREKFLRKANRILNDSELLMEAKDNDETVRIYGSSSKDGSLLEDIALLAGDALIFIRGTIRTEQVTELMKQADRD
ncbi:MAG: DUF4252 domain-containing protein [Bacteroidales bacterium]|jgi:hypothetical protein|nr:DUF4252 domain-containing protein [Bacteroidales bacterium]